MSWVDIVALVLVIAIILVEYGRGFLASLIDAGGIPLAFLLCKAIYKPVAGAVHVFKSQPANEAFFFALFFVLLVVGVFVVSHLIRNAVALELDVFDQPLGALFGIGAALAFVHGVLFALLTGAGGPSTPLGRVIVNSPLASEFLYFSKTKALYMRLVRWSRQT